MKKHLNIRNFEKFEVRRKALEQTNKTTLTAIGNTVLDNGDFAGYCENPIGAAQIPMGIAGPLQLKTQNSKIKTYFVPLATTEGALVASVSRGCKAVSRAGGVNVYAYKVGATRGPVFYTKSLAENRRLYQWLKENENQLKKVAELTSSHLAYKKMMIKGLANYTFVRFSFDTSDAMGLNMATIATQKMVEEIEKETGIPCLSVAGNFDVDKKPSWLNFINNRGHKVWAEVVLPKQVVKEILRVSPQQLYQVWLGKCVYGSMMSGSMGFNSHFANIIAALFIATGQDPAHVVEGSMGVTTTEIKPSGDLYASVYLPSLLVGTVGGGTSLPTQREALGLLGVLGNGRVEEFAEIVGATVLAGELSLLASLAEGSLAKAHEKFRRVKSKKQTAK